ncbi:conserved hypothetical protein [Rippkaea orientalis PCC 8801]|uniref:DUF4276 family protein n=1 Tax=Rippkaea orientalis (strain PCC 8801 / RF-1) TaxID=41431 RepID=B7JYG1_RIPO1|nr:DUF3226 domain-containing protein [Rippkaea orientalis]ACK64831.1 conserved hypothetical protein [Rippkaea orientalis PCC 8801]
MARKPLKVLLVEGDEDKRVIPELIEANGIPWGEKKEEAIVYIKPYGGIDNLIDPDLIYTELNASGLVSLGLIIDADEYPTRQWQRIRNVCIKTITDLPESLPETGLIHTYNNIKFGIWMMPDNQMRGILETFLAYLINENDPLWDYTQEVVQQAKNKGAKFKESYTDKSHIHTWLAWQESPGEQVHIAVKARILNPKHPKSKSFITWFKSLYDL